MNPYARLLHSYMPGQTEFEAAVASERHHVVVRAVFDHDWEQHLLVQQCSTGPAARFLHMDRWEFALYYVGTGGPVLLHTFFDVVATPLVEAAAMVACWAKCGHYGGMVNSVESDMFE